MTIAPELPTALELIQHASAWAWCAAWATATPAWAKPRPVSCAGARSATHTFNAMRAWTIAIRALPRMFWITTRFLPKSSAMAFTLTRQWSACFSRPREPKNPILITDGMSATGMPDGQYKLGDLDVEVANGRCTSAGSPGVLAGSVLTMDQAVRNFSVFTGASLAVSAQMAASNPAALMGLDRHWGLLEEGREANFVALSPEGRVLQSFRAGRPLLGQFRAEAFRFPIPARPPPGWPGARDQMA